MKLGKMLERIEEELQEPLPPPRQETQPKKRKREMAKKVSKKKTASDKEEPKKKASKKKAKAKATSKEENGKDDDYVTVQDLAEEAEIEQQTARVKLREAEVERDDGKRWRWKKNSKNLKAARKALGI